MFYVLFGEWGECYGEYETLEKAEKVCEWLENHGDDAWISCDDDAEYYDEPYDLECGFDPYEGCYSWDC